MLGGHCERRAEEMAEKIKECLIESYWNEEMGRFKVGKDDWKPVSDVQTWGAAMLRATGEKQKALRALSYAREALFVTSRDQKITALGEQAGPGRFLTNVLASMSSLEARGAMSSYRN